MTLHSNPQHTASLERRQTQMTLLREIASSLEATQTAIVSGDIRLLEQLTVNQNALCAGISAVMDAHDSDLLDAQRRVLHLTRVQSALLRRAQQTLRAISNQLIGSQSVYTPVAQDGRIDLQPVAPSSHGERSLEPCRA